MDIMENMLKDDKIIRYKYGWFPKISILEELPELYEHYQERNYILYSKSHNSYSQNVINVSSSHKNNLNNKLLISKLNLVNRSNPKHCLFLNYN